MNRSNQLIIHNYTLYKDPIVEFISEKKWLVNRRTILLVQKNSGFNNRDLKKSSIYIPRIGEDIRFSGKGVLFHLPKGSKEIDIFGKFSPNYNNDKEEDKKYHSHHTLYFINNKFRQRDKKLARKLSKVSALSSHLKAELVELLQKGSLIPAHSHGYNAIKTDEFVHKWGRLFSLSDNSQIDRNMAHPQLILVLNGEGIIYLDESKFSVKEGAVIIYGANTVHGTIAKTANFNFIHIGWVQNET